MTWLAALPPAGLVAVLILRNAVDTPYWDDWRLIGDLLVRARSGELGLGDLLAWHNDSRPFFPRLLFLLVGLLTEGDGRWLLLVTLSLAGVVSGSVFVLARATVTMRPWPLWGLVLLANLLIFTPKQAEVWLWSSYVGLAPIAALAATLALLHSGLAPGPKVAIGAALCTVATFSYANGLATWILVAPVLALAVAPRWLAWWALGFLLNAGVFFSGPAGPGGLASIPEGLQPIRLGHYVLAFLGGPLGLNRLGIATAVGALFLVLLGLAGAYLLAHARDPGLRRRMAAWLALAGYALLSGLAAAAGRSSLGVRQALTNRYIPFSLYLGLALLFLVPIVLDHAGARDLLRPTRLRAIRTAAALLLAGGVVLQANAMLIGVREIIWVGRMMRYGKSCLLFVNVHPDEACLSTWVYGSTPYVRRVANGLDRLGYLRPGLVETRRLQDLRAYGPGVRESGVFERFRSRGGSFVAAGWAGQPTGGGPADAVILARRERNGDWVPLEFAPVLNPRPDVAREHGGNYFTSGWRRVMAESDLSRRPFPVGAWAFDAHKGWALPLEGVHTVEGTP